MKLGPNGSGKSTFLKIFSAVINEYEGSVLYRENKIFNLKKEELAKYWSEINQQPELSFPLTVDEVVMMEIYPTSVLTGVKKNKAI